MAFMAVLESDLRALSAEARRRYPAVKDGAEHAILKLRSLSSPSEIAHNEDILQIFLMACEVRTVKLSVIGLSCLQKLISHDAVAPSALKEILATLKDHAEMSDESVQLKTLQTILIIFQSRLQPENEENMAQALGICLRLLENNRSSDSVRNTAAATFRQAVALIFDHVVCAESLPAGKFGSGGYSSRSSSVTSDINRSINRAESLEHEFISGGQSLMRETLTTAGKLGLRLLEDLTALAAGGSAIWLRVSYIQRTFALDILEFILSNYVVVFRTLVPYEQVLRHQICSLLMTSLRTNAELEGEAGEPYFRRLVLRSVSHLIRLYSSTLITECEVFLSMLVKVISLDLPLWHRILVLELLRGFCVEARTLRILFQTFDMNPKNTNVVDGMVKALARVVSSVQVQDTSEESLAAVAGMFSSKAKGIEWSLENDASNAAVLVASEAHTITLAIEGLLGVVFTVATLTDEAVDAGELESPRCDSDPLAKCTGKTAVLCMSMVDSMWLTILDALSLILTKSQGEAIVLEILKGYQAFTQACGVLRAVEPLNSFLASLCKFTINIPSEPVKWSGLQSPSSKRSELLVDQRDSIVLTPKNVQALRTLFNVAHRLHNVLGPSWVLVLETLAALDRAIHSPHATTQEVSTGVSKLTRESSGQYSDFSILSSLNSQLFESSALMNISAVKSLLSALCQLSHQCVTETVSGFGQVSSQKIGSISFSVERMISILVNNLHRVEPLWDQVVGHFLELADNANQNLRNMALDALDQSICAVLGSDQFQENAASRLHGTSREMEALHAELRSLECAVVSPLRVLYVSNQSIDVRAGSLKILLHVLERHGENLHYSWPNILDMLRSVADASEKDLVTLGFQSLRIIMNDGLSSIPADCLHVCIDVTGAYSAQKTALNISLTAVGLLWTTTDFIAKGLLYGVTEEEGTGLVDMHFTPKKMDNVNREEQATNTINRVSDQSFLMNIVDRDKLLFSVFSLLQKLGADERPEVRNSAVRTLFQTLGSHGQKLSKSMWEDCLWNYVFPTLDRASHMAATSSKAEWQGKELGTRGGKAVHMLIHHSRNTAQKQWDETLVLVLGGIARLLRSFFPFLRSLSNFWSGWESLLLFVKNSILHGSKEVALAAINCLQSTVISHSPKGNLPLDYLKSVLDVYELVLQNSENYGDNAASKVKQEILQGLGELYEQAQAMFDNAMYTRLLAIVHMAVKQAKFTNYNFEAEFGHVPPVQRTVLEILPLLHPAEHLSSMWSFFLGELLHYLPFSDSSVQSVEDKPEQTSTAHHIHDSNKMIKPEVPDGTDLMSPNTSTTAGISTYLLAEKLVPVLVDLFLQAPAIEKYNIFPEIVQGLGRCMTTRRDNPEGGLWRLAVEGFNRILVDDVSKLTTNCGPDTTVSRPARIRIWKEVADVYERFLVGYCGRALPSNSMSATVLKSDESLEMNILQIYVNFSSTIHAMKLRLRSSETKETLKIEVSTPCSIQHLKEIVAQRLTSSSSSAAASVHLSLNRKDELLGSSPQDSLQALGITSGDLIFFTLDPNCFSSETLIVQSNSSQSQNCQKALTLEPSSQKERNLDTQKEETLDSESVKTETRELDTHKEEKTLGLDTQMDDGGDESIVDVGKSFSVPGFLRKVFWKEVGEGDGGDHKLLVIAVHAVLIESGFVGFDSVSRRKVEGFHLPDEWPSLQFTMSLQYTLPEIIKQGPITINGVETVKLKFQSLGKFVNVYGSLAKNGSGPYGVRLDEDHLVFFLNLIWANCDSIDEMNGKDGFSNLQAAREVFEFWKTVKDKLALPLLIDLCERAGLAPPPCFMRLPTDLKLKILESLCGVDVAKVGSVCSELRYLSSNDDLWRRKFVEQFGNVEGSQGGSHWKEKFAKSWETRKRRKKDMWERPRVRGEPWPFRVGVTRIIRDPHPLRVLRIIGGDHDIGPDFPFGLSLRTNAHRNVMPHCSLFGHRT